MVNASPEQNLPVLNFVYHLLKPWSDQFAHVNAKQPQLQTSSLTKTSRDSARSQQMS